MKTCEHKNNITVMSVRPCQFDPTNETRKAYEVQLLCKDCGMVLHGEMEVGV